MHDARSPTSTCERANARVNMPSLATVTVCKDGLCFYIHIRIFLPLLYNAFKCYRLQLSTIVLPSLPRRPQISTYFLHKRKTLKKSTRIATQCPARKFTGGNKDTSHLHHLEPILTFLCFISLSSRTQHHCPGANGRDGSCVMVDIPVGQGQKKLAPYCSTHQWLCQKHLLKQLKGEDCNKCKGNENRGNLLAQQAKDAEKAKADAAKAKTDAAKAKTDAYKKDRKPRSTPHNKKDDQRDGAPGTA
ncbi:unnamed protein product [Periconia digitata]|uniref:Uncharacterized protein n=1 Tax=Periconia digitata TaxID=1303443 RepID=A0A9W4XGV6_9PLEO|nr:unnamed protein product [Periconia digitata]